MTARSWSEDDPEPSDHPPVVDAEDITWLWNPYDGIYERQKFTHYPNPDGGPDAVAGSPILGWDEILEEYGPLREATTEESRRIVETWAVGRDHD